MKVCQTFALGSYLSIIHRHFTVMSRRRDKVLIELPTSHATEHIEWLCWGLPLMEHILVVSLFHWANWPIFCLTFLHSFLSWDQIFVLATKRRKLIWHRDFRLPQSWHFLCSRYLFSVEILLLNVKGRSRTRARCWLEVIWGAWRLHYLDPNILYFRFCFSQTLLLSCALVQTFQRGFI